MIFRYVVMIRKTTTGYSANVPDLPGCIAASQTVEQTRRLIAQALQLHVELMHESGERIPKPKSRLQLTESDASEGAFCTWVRIERPAVLSA